VRVLLFGHEGKVGRALEPALRTVGHEVEGTREPRSGFDAAVDFTRPEAVVENVRGCLALGVPCVVGTSGFDEAAVGSRLAARGFGLSASSWPRASSWP
jgi:4-hydroxy-tetrahydrodipicolinate reductase